MFKKGAKETCPESDQYSPHPTTFYFPPRQPSLWRFMPIRILLLLVNS